MVLVSSVNSCATTRCREHVADKLRILRDGLPLYLSTRKLGIDKTSVKSVRGILVVRRKIDNIYEGSRIQRDMIEKVACTVLY